MRRDETDDLDVRLALLAGKQGGAFHRSDARRLGFTRSMIERRVRIGAWSQFSRDVFLLAGFPHDWEQRCWAATLLHPAAAISHRTSATRLRLARFRPGRVQIAVPPTASHRHPQVVTHRSRHIQFAMVGGMRTTTFAQTMVQLAEREPDPALRDALRSGLDANHGRADQLRQRLAELRGRRLPGYRRLVEQLEVVDGEPPTASELEHELFAIVDDAAMPPVERQARVPWSPDRPTLLDGVCWAWKLVIEGDGRRWHTRISDFERDRWRDNEAAIAGLHVMRFTWQRIKHDRRGIIDQLHRYGERFGASAA